MCLDVLLPVICQLVYPIANEGSAMVIYFKIIMIHGGRGGIGVFIREF